MLEALAWTFLGGELGGCGAKACTCATLGRACGLGGVHASDALVFTASLVLSGFIERLLGNHDSLADFGG